MPGFCMDGRDRAPEPDPELCEGFNRRTLTHLQNISLTQPGCSVDSGSPVSPFSPHDKPQEALQSRPTTNQLIPLANPGHFYKPMDPYFRSLKKLRTYTKVSSGPWDIPALPSTALL